MPATKAWNLRRFTSACAMLVLAWLLIRGLSGPVAQALVYLSPALLLLGFLSVRRYPGERALLRAMPSATSSSKITHRGRARREPARVLLPRGGRLIASSLAVRPPPGPAALSF
jgi:hypothetical protein